MWEAQDIFRWYERKKPIVFDGTKPNNFIFDGKLYFLVDKMFFVFLNAAGRRKITLQENEDDFGMLHELKKKKVKIINSYKCLWPGHVEFIRLCGYRIRKTKGREGTIGSRESQMLDLPNDCAELFQLSAYA